MSKAQPKKPNTPPAPVVDVAVSKCINPECGSTRRADYRGIHREQIEGELPDGTAYNCIVWRRTHCLDCGQNRVDRSFEMIHEGEQETPEE